jgi:beta-phosphoglucomutase
VIEAIIFDLDGTLVQTEPLKARSHALATLELSPVPLTEEQVIAASQDLYGISERLTALALIERFSLQDSIKLRLAEFGVLIPWEAFLKLQRSSYMDMLADRQALRQLGMSETLAVLDKVRRDGFRVALATMSYRDQAEAVLAALGLAHDFEVVVTAEDVLEGKPDPEIYWLVAQRLGLAPHQCLVIEDTLAGVQSAIATGMWCIAVPTYLTRDEVHSGHLLDERWILDDPAALYGALEEMLQKRMVQEAVGAAILEQGVSA